MSDSQANASDGTPERRPIVVLGPTAGGKSDLAMALALRCAECDGQPGQVVSADSMQVYRHMDAGTAKPSPDERARVLHHLIDHVEPTERFTVSDWLAEADGLIKRLRCECVRPIVVGGTNLYIKALLEGLFDGPPANAALRAELAEVEPAELHKRLKSIDPDAASRIHPNDRKRLTRAIEVYETTGQPISAMQTQWDESQDTTDMRAANTYRHNPHLFALRWPVDAINARINLRVKAMFYPDKARVQDGVEHWPSESLIDETRRLESLGLLGPQAREALGYKQVLEHLAGRLTEDEAFERTKIETRRFGKQQRTWLKRFTGVHWLDAAGRPASDLCDEAWQMIRDHGTR